MEDAERMFDRLVASFISLSPIERRRSAFTFVRDIPYGNIGSRSPYDVLAANKGTCSGKHALLKLLLEALGESVQSWFAVHDFSRFPIRPWPAELSAFASQTLPDYHDFLKVHVAGEWLTIDAIFDAPLLALGFPVQDWDGASSMVLPVEASSIFPAEGSMEDHKKRLIAALPPDRQAARKQFLEALTSWLDGRREKIIHGVPDRN